MNSKFLGRTAAAVALGLVPVLSQANSYSIVDLGWRRYPVQINNRGDIAGQSVRHLVEDAMLWRGQRWHRLSDGGGRSYSLGIDAQSNVVGMFDKVPWLWPRGQSGHEISLPEGHGYGQPSGIASDGTIVGDYINANEVRCFRTLADGTSSDLGSPGEGNFCQANGVNRDGVIVGEAEFTPHGGHQAFLWREGVFQALGSFSTSNSYGYASAVNSQNQVVGCAMATTLLHAFLFSGGTLKDIGDSPDFPKGTCAYGISDKGEIVGRGVGKGPQRAVRFAAGQTISLASEVTNLGDWRLQVARSVNNDGVIVGVGTRRGKQHGFMLLPQAAR